MTNEETRPAPTSELLEKGFLTVSSHTETPTNQTIAQFFTGLDNTSSTADSGDTSSGSDNS